MEKVFKAVMSGPLITASVSDPPPVPLKALRGTGGDGLFAKNLLTALLPHFPESCNFATSNFIPRPLKRGKMANIDIHFP